MSWNDFEFIEIGTADWGTITHYCENPRAPGRIASSLGSLIKSHIRHPWHYRGIAADPVRAHLRSLPNLPCVHKWQGALDEHRGTAPFYYVPPGAIRRYAGCYWYPFSAEPGDREVDVFYYAGSLGSLGHAHPNLAFMLEGIGRADLLRATQVRVGDWGTLCETFGVGRVDVLQLDCEGRDCAILRGMMRYCRARPWSFPRIIQFEANHLTPALEVESTLADLAHCGYRITYRSMFNVMVTRHHKRCRATRRRRAR